MVSLLKENRGLGLLEFILFIMTGCHDRGQNTHRNFTNHYCSFSESVRERWKATSSNIFRQKSNWKIPKWAAEKWIMLVIIRINCGFKLPKVLFSVNKENISFHLPSLQGVSFPYSNDAFQVEYHFTSSHSTSKWCKHSYSS